MRNSIERVFTIGFAACTDRNAKLAMQSVQDLRVMARDTEDNHFAQCLADKLLDRANFKGLI